jgi:EAL domain-containing protein (putative c-di-GMP-specific phosphodiesterase class I)
LAVLDLLAANGVRLAVDDFGTGHSSLAYLERLPVSEVKIDRSFVTRLEREETDAKVVRATVALAHDLGLDVVAEGVESRVAWARVADLGCELIQGYALARPMPGMETVAWLDSRLTFASEELREPLAGSTSISRSAITPSRARRGATWEDGSAGGAG